MNQEKNYQEYSLTREERIRMRRAVYQYMEMKPLRAPQARAAWHFGALYSPRALAAGLVVALFASSAGVSLAAQNTLPGDLLYPVKTNITEPLQGALATTPSAKAAWAVSVAGERVKEAAELAAEGRLSTSTQQELAANFSAHADIAIATISTEASTSPETGAQAAISFASQLSEYQQVLADIASPAEGGASLASGGASSTIASSTPLSTSIMMKRARLAAISAHVEAYLSMMSTASTTTDTLAAAHMRDAAQAQLQGLQALAQATAGALSASSSAQVESDLTNASTSISTGDQLLQNDAVPQAFTSFQNALSAAEKLGVFLQTSSAIHERTGLIIGQPSASSTPSRHFGQHRAHAENIATSSAAVISTTDASTSTSTSAETNAPSDEAAAAPAQEQAPAAPAVSLPIPVPSLP